MRIELVAPLLAFFLLSIAFGLGLFHLNASARFVPLFVLSITFSMLLLESCRTLFLLPHHSDDERKKDVFEPRCDDSQEENKALRFAADFLWFTAAPILILLLGFIYGSTLYIFLFVTIRAGVSVVRAGLYASATGAGIFAITKVLPDNQAYNGLLGSWLGL